ncbi:unnamed protein product [Paramecium sonneborni]|uniref:Uncharacterized protein n=1 Tax=Paramecium sonneborni TaxID=65129 RepID=A0A8S1RB28_9CILI|nr:unnamed protein product [Paramecium sonneborni]
MMISLEMMVFYILTTIVWSQQFVTYHKGVCRCEELNEKECDGQIVWMKGRCKMENGKCVSRSCEEIHNIDVCLFIGCQQKNNKCQKPISCNQQTEQECEDIFNYECVYDSNLNRCLSYYDPIPDESIPTCAERPVDQCYLAREGLCIVKDDKCQELTTCEDIKNDDLCVKTYPACLMNSTNSCITNNKCDNPFSSLCGSKKQKINGDQYILCNKLDDNTCVNFDPSIESQDTCYSNSMFFFHWDGQNCVQCKGQEASAQEITIFIIFILLINYI